jgi:hypothetical protein
MSFLNIDPKIEIMMYDEKQKIRVMAGKIIPKTKTKLSIEEQIETAVREQYDSNYKTIILVM